jgi:hypothetical protein
MRKEELIVSLYSLTLCNIINETWKVVYGLHSFETLFDDLDQFPQRG